jgi:hypothetical protein
LKRSTSINSIFETHKEKEMADFRKLFYALAVVALLAGLTVPVSAQAPFVCSTSTSPPPLLRGEGYTELVGDLILNCTGGIPTAGGQAVPQANFTIFLNTNVTSKLLTANGIWSEALLIVDEPHSPVNPTRQLTNCGLSGAPDNGPSGAGVCSIVSNGNPAMTYDGSQNTYGTLGACGTAPAPASGSYGCGRPNVFQARIGSFISATQSNAVTWSGVPIDPPGTTTTRTFRFTNIRANATSLIGSILPSSTFTTTYVQAQISVSGNTTMSINTPQQIVGYILRGLTATGPTTTAAFLQCNAVTATSPPNPVNIILSEGFNYAWKPRNISEVIANSASGNNGGAYIGGVTPACGTTTTSCGDNNQNVAGAIYYTEAGFQNGPTSQDPSPNPPAQTDGGIAVTASLGNAFSSDTGIQGAGIANQGTRLALAINTSTLPTGTTLFPFSVTVPSVLPIMSGTTQTGVAVLTSTDANGAGAFSPPTAVAGAVAVPSSGLIVYEVLYADPFALETLTIPISVVYTPVLSSNSPTPGLTTTGTVSFAPFYSTAAAALPSTTLSVPRFTSLLSSMNLFTVLKCACDLLFPYVSAGGGYDTGIAIANTSLDPGATFGFFGVPQSGTVEFWYYGNGTAVPTQCTNTTSPGTCPGTTLVNPGQVLTYVLSTGSTTWGLDNRAAAFTGYIIAQAQFQYCHAFAFIGALGGGPTSPGISEGYLGLIMGVPLNEGLYRTPSTSEQLVQ